MMDRNEFEALSEAHSRELFALANAIKNEMDGCAGVKEKIAAKRRGLDAMLGMLKEQQRVWTYQAGEKIEPVAHDAAAVLLPAFGGGAA